MPEQTRFFSTGQVAEICQMAPKTVRMWMRKGLLKGFRLPGSKHRRVPRSMLIKFLKENHMLFLLDEAKGDWSDVKR